MFCAEMKELEAGYTEYGERRQRTILPEHEKRRASTGGHRAGHARIAYLMQVHRLRCPVCGYSVINAGRPRET